MRRTDHYANTLFQPYLVTAATGAGIILIGIFLQILQLYVSIKNRHALRDHTGDPWHGRTLEWSIASPAPLYNFATLPTVTTLDQFWVDKEHHLSEGHVHPKELHYHDIHMPKNTPAGFIIAMFTGITGFALIWHMWIPSVIGFLGVLTTVIARTFSKETDYYIDAEIVKQTELAHIKEIA